MRRAGELFLKSDIYVVARNRRKRSERAIFLRLFWMLVCALAPSMSRAQAPVFVISPGESWIKFHVKASTNIAGKFDKWDASLTFTSPEEDTGSLKITIQADSVDTGSGLKNGKL